VTKQETGELPVSYIVRIYRSESPEELAGTVDVPERATHLTFASFEELKSILLAAPSETAASG
jgi:hypothetical protein